MFPRISYRLRLFFFVVVSFGPQTTANTLFLIEGQDTDGSPFSAVWRYSREQRFVSQSIPPRYSEEHLVVLLQRAAICPTVQGTTINLQKLVVATLLKRSGLNPSGREFKSLRQVLNNNPIESLPHLNELTSNEVNHFYTSALSEAKNELGKAPPTGPEFYPDNLKHMSRGYADLPIDLGDGYYKSQLRSGSFFYPNHFFYSAKEIETQISLLIELTYQQYVAEKLEKTLPRLPDVSHVIAFVSPANEKLYDEVPYRKFLLQNRGDLASLIRSSTHKRQRISTSTMVSPPPANPHATLQAPRRVTLTILSGYEFDALLIQSIVNPKSDAIFSYFSQERNLHRDVDVAVTLDEWLKEKGGFVLFGENYNRYREFCEQLRVTALPASVYLEKINDLMKKEARLQGYHTDHLY